MRETSAAVDLGTSEIRVSLWDMGAQQRIALAAEANPQSAFGSDVLSRLTAAAESPAQAAEIGRFAGNAIAALLRKLCRERDIPLSAIRVIMIVGNTAMLTLLTGEGYRDLLRPGMWRREIACGFADTAAAAKAWGLDPSCGIELVQPLAGLVGSDLTAGIHATRLTDGPSGSLLIDFGTNTEIALWDGNRIWATSAAGGPAFEGCGISAGMPAVDGAVQRVEWSDASGFFSLGVIGNGPPKGICGSGLVDAAVGLLRRGMLTKAGRFKGDASGWTKVQLDDQGAIAVTGRDIDALQRAKAGVAAAQKCLMAQAGTDISGIRRVCVAGAFGNYLNVGNAQVIGLLPPVGGQDVEFCGNTALAGCEMLLSGVAPLTVPAYWHPTVVNMSHVRAYEDMFVESLYLEPWQGAVAAGKKG